MNLGVHKLVERCTESMYTGMHRLIKKGKVIHYRKVEDEGSAHIWVLQTGWQVGGEFEV